MSELKTKQPTAAHQEAFEHAVKSHADERGFDYTEMVISMSIPLILNQLNSGGQKAALIRSHLSQVCALVPPKG